MAVPGTAEVAVDMVAVEVAVRLLPEATVVGTGVFLLTAGVVVTLLGSAIVAVMVVAWDFVAVTSVG